MSTDLQVTDTAMHRADTPLTERELDDELRTAVATAAKLRRLFYGLVLIIALGGQVSGAMETLGLPLLAALGAALPLELGAVVVLNNADVRRRLGERATLSRALSAGIAVGSTTWAIVSHTDPIVGGFCAAFSLLGYLVWLMDSENGRRDRLRAKNQLPPTTPAYEVFGHWVRHPWLTRRAKSLAKRTAGLDLYESLVAADEQVRRERRESAMAKVLHRKIKASVDKDTADIAIAVYDLHQIAARLAAGADYTGLTALIAADLAPARIAAANPQRTSDTTPPVLSGRDSMVDTGELGQLLAGLLPGVAPVSPAPYSGSADLDRTSDQTCVRTSADRAADPERTPARTSARTSTDPGTDPQPTGRRTPARTSARTSTAGAATNVAQLLPTAREVAEQLAATGVSVSRATLAPALRERGVAVSTNGAGALVKALKGRSEARPARRKPNVKRTRTAGDAR